MLKKVSEFYNVNSHEIFNLIQDIGSRELIIDLRSKEQYELNHIKTAINVSPPESTTGIDTIEEFNLTNYISTYINANWNLVNMFQKVILYSDKPFTVDLDKVEKTTVYTQTKEAAADNIIKSLVLSEWDQIILKHLLSYRKKVKILIYQHGFNSFEQTYPFQCIGSHSLTSDTIETIPPVSLYPSEIIENFMYLGGQDNAASREQIENLKVTHIINMTCELQDVYPTIYKYYRADLDDESDVNIYAHLEPCIDFINQAKAQNGRVLVHCAMGRSRSSSVVIAYLMKQNSLTFPDALKYCKSKRSIVNPNFGFTKQLKEYQVYLDKLKQKEEEQA